MSISIVAIDDDANVLDVYCEYINDHESSYQIKTFLNPMQGCEYLLNVESKPDVVLVDINMPGMNGIQLIEKLSANNFQIPIIVVTGYADKELAIKALNLGAYALLEKPIDFEVFFRMLESSTNHYRSVQFNIQLIDAQQRLVDLIKSVHLSQEQRLMASENRLFEITKDSPLSTEERKKQFIRMNYEKQLWKEIRDIENQIDIVKAELQTLSPWKVAS